MTTTNTGAVLTLDQRRAQHALRNVRNVPKALQSDYQAAAKSLPANIVMNGLGQACAMLLAQSKGKSPDGSGHRQLYEHLKDWLQGPEHAAVYPDAQDLIEAVISHGQTEYVRAQVEALAHLDWLKKFSQAYLAGEED